MNKLFSKIAALSVGLAMAVGVGVAISHKEVSKVEAKSYAAAYTLDCASASENGSQSDYGVNSTTVMTASGIRAFLVKANGGSDIFTSTGVDGVSGSIYWRKGSGGAGAPDYCLKLGKAGGPGQFTMHLSDGADAISKVSITGYCWKTDTAVSVNGSEAQKAETKLTEITFDYELASATKDITLSSATSCICITEIVLYKESASVSPTSISCDNQEIIATTSVNLNSAVSFEPAGTTEKGLSFELVSGSDKISLNSETGLVTGLSAGSGVVKITPNDTSAGATAINVTITVSALEVTSIEASGTKKVDFVEEQPLSFGNLKVKVNYNSGTSSLVEMDNAGVSVMFDGELVEGTRYLSINDNGKTVTVSYAGYNFEYTINVTAKGEEIDGYWTQITDTSDFVENLEVIVVSSGSNYAMGKYAGTGNNIPAVAVTKDEDGKINGTVAGVQTYRLKLSDGTTSVDENTFALYDGEGYLCATGGTSNNYLKRTATIDSTKTAQYSFVLTTESVTANTGSTYRNVMKFNPNNGNPIFACYASTSANANAVLYKFVSQQKSEDLIAVENFCKTSLHLDSTKADYIDFNDNTKGTACLSYYGIAKSAYNALSDEQKSIFATSAEFIIARGRDRLQAWAEANGEEFDPINSTFTNILNAHFSFEDNNNMMIIIVVISSITVLSLGVLLALKKKKHN